ncbi:hypothetical protein CAL7716_047110 [Calothrix sp. PCC 7716]|nr:hypothetical protein CAL7716_047110 [Calothrix sp. PCC 7716]
MKSPTNYQHLPPGPKGQLIGLFKLNQINHPLHPLPALTLTCIILETMRLYPPVWAMPQTIATECKIGAYPVKRGHGLLACQWIVHRDARWFSNPDTFNPERWDNDLAKRLPSFAYFPFGGGTRVCVGKAFAMMETVSVLATIAQTYRFTLVSEQPIQPWASLTLRPQQPKL